MAGAAAVGILSPSMSALFVPSEDNALHKGDRYVIFEPLFARCRLVLVEGDSQATAPKIEVWRRDLGTPPLASHDKSVLAVVTDDMLSISATAVPRSDVGGLVDWILANPRLRDRQTTLS
jgi:molybdopterin-guanine dinucleotide biosynthesis protein